MTARGSAHLLVRVLAAVLLGGVLLIASRRPSPPPVYSVAALRAGLLRSPGRWVEHTVRVRGVADSRCQTGSGAGLPGRGQPVCSAWRADLQDPAGARATAEVSLLLAPPALLTALRRLPLARWLVGAPQQIQWGTLSTYRVRLQAAPPAMCATPPCYAALLLDAVPDGL